MARKKTVPFSVERNDARTLLAQVADGLREAIVRGYYAPGNTVPSSRALARDLGVSEIVARAALRRLADEGVLEARPRIGSVVRDPGAKQWFGHVVFIYPDFDVGYFQTLFAEELRVRLNRAGFLFSRASVAQSAAGEPADFSLVDAALARSVDLVIVLHDRPAIFRRLARRGVPFAAIADADAVPAGAVGFTRYDYKAAVADFVAACADAGARHMVQWRWDRLMCDAAPDIRSAGLRASSIFLQPDFAPGHLRGVELAGYTGFRRWLAAHPHPHARDTIHFFSDDYLARGAMLAMWEAGLRAPEDIRFVTWANAGLCPLYPREPSRMEMDPAGSAAVVADAALAYLRDGLYPAGTSFGPRWLAGETIAPHRP